MIIDYQFFFSLFSPLIAAERNLARYLLPVPIVYTPSVPTVCGLYSWRSIAIISALPGPRRAQTDGVADPEAVFSWANGTLFVRLCIYIYIDTLFFV